MSASKRAKRQIAFVRAAHPGVADEKLRAAFAIVEELGPEERADEDEQADRFATRIADLVIDLVDKERVRRGLPRLK